MLRAPTFFLLQLEVFDFQNISFEVIMLVIVSQPPLKKDTTTRI